MENFTCEGVFWIPQETDQIEVSGILKYDVESGIKLRTIGKLFPSDEGRFEFEIINGFSSTGKAITLINSFRTGGNNFRPISFENYTCNYILLGEKYYKDIKSIKFKKLKARFAHFDQWYNRLDTINVNTNRESGKISVDYNLPEAISYNLSKAFTIKFNTIATVPQKKHDGAEISQKTQVIFSNSRSKNLEYWLNNIFSFQEIITIFSQSCCYPTELYFSEIEENIEVKTSFMYQINTSEYLIRDIQHPRDFLIPFHAIKHKLSLFLKSWYSSQDTLETCYIPYFNNFYQKKTYTTDKFLNISRASEAFHRETISTNRYYAKRLEDLFSNCSRSFNGLLRIRNKSSFCIKLKDYRNDFTHSNPITLPLQKKYLNTHYLTEKLTIILTCNLLKYHGLNTLEIRNYLNNYSPYSKYKYRRKIT